MRLAPRALLSAVTALFMAATVPMSSAQTLIVDPDFFPGACRDVDAMTAIAQGRGIPIYVALNDEPIITVDPPAAEAIQVGPGKSGDKVGAVDVAVPGIVTAQVLHSRVDLDVDNESEGLEAEAWTITRLAHVNVLDGLVTADLVRAFAYARADVRSARTWTDPSTIVGLQIAGVSYTDIAPGTNITLPQPLFGDGSYVSVYERMDHSMRPSPENPYWVADVQVRMINVHISNMPLLGEVDVIISDSYARAQAPNPWCGQAQSVEAGGYTLRIREALDMDESDGQQGLLLNEQHIGVTGGSAHSQLLGQLIDLGDLQVEINVTEVDQEGEIIMDVESRSDSMSQLLEICIRLEGPNGPCFVEAVVVRAEAHCYANATVAFCDGMTTILRLIIDGVDVCAALGLDEGEGLSCTPEAGTEMPIGPIMVYLNQHERVQEDGFASLYVRAVRIETGLPFVGTIIIGRAYASAGFEDVSANAETDEWNL